jgi:hypothetical protein
VDLGSLLRKGPLRNPIDTSRNLYWNVGCDTGEAEQRAAVGGLGKGPLRNPIDTSRNLCWNVGCDTGEANKEPP